MKARGYLIKNLWNLCLNHATQNSRLQIADTYRQKNYVRCFEPRLSTSNTTYSRTPTSTFINTNIAMWRKKTLNDDDNSVSTAATVTTAVILEETSATATNQVHFELHPIHSMAAEWRHAELENVFTRHPHRYPIELAGHSGYERSLGALFDYPLHACVIALRKKLTEFKQTRKSDIFNQATGSASSLIR